MESFPSSVSNHSLLYTMDNRDYDLPKKSTNQPNNNDISAFLSEQKKVFLDDTLHIGTHNIRGITRSTDQELLIQEIWDKKLDILGLCETKLTQSNQIFAFNTNKDKYKCFPSSCPNNPRGAGVLLLVHKDLEKHIVQVDKLEGHLVAINLLSKKHKTWIAQIYLPCDKRKSINIQRKIQSMIQNKLHQQYQIIIMGDFNATLNPRLDRKCSNSNNSFTPSEEPEAQIFHHLSNWNLIDLHQLWDEQEPSHTWKNIQSSSRIDYIWSTTRIANSMLNFQNYSFTEITNSDHTFLELRITRDILIHTPLPQQIQTKTQYEKIINLNKTSEEQWEKFKTKIDAKISKLKFSQKIEECQQELLNTPEQIESIQVLWNDFEKALIATAINNLHCEKRTPRGLQKTNGKSQNQKEKKLIQIYRNLQKIQKEIQKLNSKPPSPFQIQQLDIWIIKASKALLSNTQATTELSSLNLNTSNKDLPQLIEQISILKTLLKKTCIQEEKKRINQEIQKAIEVRCKNLKNNQRRIVQTLTNNFRDKIIIDRIKIIDEENKEYLTIDKEEILNQTELYYQEAFRKRNSNFDLLDDQWKKQYEPKPEIQNSWYNTMDDKIQMYELEEILQDLLNNKASGPSKIKYEMLKKMGPLAKKILCDFFNLFLVTGTTPPSWKNSLLYPISKGKEWQGELSNTRPIILLEATRKCFTKILNNRLALICKNKNILKGPNFAGLPGESTSEPIHLLNNICEEAREENKELWILLQDTAKAYDTVSLEMLKRALQRIKVPTKTIKLILDPFTQRTTRVITNIGLTKEIIAGDGIDQGETISPLLWRIFYDPLLCEIQENHNLGYSMNCSWPANFSESHNNPNAIKQLTIRQAAIAYMDDTTWIARSQTDMNHILERAKWFYAANDSQINGSKSVLITINSQNKQPNKIYLGVKQEEVKELDRKCHSRFLGIWLGCKDQNKDTIKRIQHEIQTILPNLGRKLITDKHVEYIINRVLIPRIEYRIQHSSISSYTANLLSIQLRKTIKQVSKILGTIPNPTIHHKSFYRLKSIWEIQLESQITNLLNRLNNIDHPGTSTLIRLKQAQIKHWEPSNILSNNIVHNSYKKNLSAQILKTANKLNITFSDSQWTDIFQWKGGHISIKTLLKSDTVYNKAISSLKKNSIMFVDQLINKESCALLDWRIVQTLKSHGQGPVPIWYQIIKRELANEFGVLKQKWINYNWIPQDRMLFSKNEHLDSRKWNWQVGTNNKNNKLLWFRTKGTLGTPNIKIEHYQLSSCTPPGSTKLNKVLADQLNFNENQSLSFNWINNITKHRKNKTPIIPAEIHTLENLVKAKSEKLYPSSLTTSKFQHIEIEDYGVQIIQDNIAPGDYLSWLRKEYNLNVNKNYNGPYQFYTDGSLGKAHDQSSRMGAAWLQTEGPNPGRTFQAGIDNWPSSTRAELVAILLATLSVPNGSIVEIRTDSAACIATFETINKPHPKKTIKRLMKIPNWQLWLRLANILSKKELQLKLTKVKAHSKDVLNNQVDLLAKAAKEEPAIRWNALSTIIPITTPEWNNIPIDTSLRTFIKDYNEREILVQWASLNRIDQRWNNEIRNPEKFDWKGLWKHNKGKGSLITSFKQMSDRTFKTKLIHNELSTMDNLIKRKALDTPNNTTCFFCQLQEETLDHILTCKEIQGKKNEIWKQAQDKLIQSWIPNHSSNKKAKGNTTALIKLLERWEKTKSFTSKDLINIIIGLWSKDDIKEWTSALQAIKISKTSARKVLNKISHFWCKKFRQLIWNPRCEKLQDRKRQLQNKGKGKETSSFLQNRTNKIVEASSSNKSQEKESVQYSKSITEIVNRTPNSSNQIIDLSKILWDKIKEGKKWLGI